MSEEFTVEKFPQEMMTFEELLMRHQEAMDQEAELAAEVRRRQNLERLEYRREVTARCDMLGTTPAELFGFAVSAAKAASASQPPSKPKRARSSSNGDPKYQNPENPVQTWTGRGRNPVWVQEQKARFGDEWELRCRVSQAPDQAILDVS